MSSSRQKHARTSSLLVNVLQYFLPLRVMVIELKFFFLEYSADSLISMILSKGVSFLGVQTSTLISSGSDRSVSSERLRVLSLSSSKSKGLDFAFSFLLSRSMRISVRQSLYWWQPWAEERQPQRQNFLSMQEDSDESESLKLRSFISALCLIGLLGRSDLPSYLNWLGWLGMVELRDAKLALLRMFCRFIIVIIIVRSEKQSILVLSENNCQSLKELPQHLSYLFIMIDRYNGTIFEYMQGYLIPYLKNGSYVIL